MANTPASLTEQIENIKNMQISYRVLHSTIDIIYDENTKIKIPLASITNKYRDFLNSIVVSFNLNEKEQERYMYNPKLLSEDLYQTTEMWNDILLLNQCVSISDFKPTVVKFYDPDRFKGLLNELMMLEEQNGEISY